MNLGLTQSTLDKLNGVFIRYPEIQKVLIYGSRATGNYREGSDIDLALAGDHVTDDTRRKVWLDLDALDTPYLIDITVYGDLASGEYKHQIDTFGKLLYEREQETLTP